MTTDPLEIAWWAKNIDEIDHEIARLCVLCRVPLLDEGVIERVLRRDETVCRTANRAAFSRLHDMLMVHFAVRQKSVKALGQVQTASIEANAIEQLRNRFAGVLGDWRVP